jgi:transcriptional regulator with XRE-family HTH domain/tetratricopeptide (TPR) repeat protein
MSYHGGVTPDMEGRPAWAERLQRERAARGWTQSDAVRAMRTFSDSPLPAGLLDQWKRWERGRNKPDESYRPLIAATFGTVVESIFGSDRAPSRPSQPDSLLISRSGMDTHELVQRIRRSSVDNVTLDALALTVEQLCCEYAMRHPADLIADGRAWLRRITRLLDERLTFTQHRDLLDAASWLTLLIGCLEYDTGDYRSAEATRTGALQLGTEAGNPAVVGWGHEMRAWFALTTGRYREVIEAAQAGQDAARDRSVTVQLLAQEAKAWARSGNQRNTIRALEKGRVLLDSLPYPERPDNHFVVDPEKFDYYAMDCYRLIGDDQLAEMLAREIMGKTVTSDGRVTSPMRRAESMLTLGVVAARAGDLNSAIEYGNDALSIDRKSQPSLYMVASEMTDVLGERYPGEPTARDFRKLVDELTRPPAA